MADTLLLVEDDVVLGETLRFILTKKGFKVEVANTAISGLEKAHARIPDAIILDVMLPDMDGWQTCCRLREMTTVPIIMLTVLDSRMDMVKALNMGADDYIVKPVTADVLTTRIRTLLSRSSHLNTKRKSDQSSIVKCDHLTIDCNKREVKIDGDRIELNPTEFRLLSVLARHQGRTLPYEYLLTKVWGREYIGEKEYLRLYIGYLRRKLERDPSKPSLIHSVWRIGYRLGPCHKSDPEYLLMVA